MLKKLPEFRKLLIITGFRKVRIGSFDGFLNKVRKNTPPHVTLQFFDADLVADWQHLYFAAYNALTAFKHKRTISKSLGMEILLYASAQHQIARATEIIGVKPSSLNLAVVIISGRARSANLALSAISRQVNSEPDESVLELSSHKVARIRKTFEINDAELVVMRMRRQLSEALVDLVIERMALLSTER